MPAAGADTIARGRMESEPDTTRAQASGGRAWARPAALVASCLVIGFVAGWVVRGDDGPVTVLAPGPPAADGGGATTSAGSTTTAPGATAEEPPAAPPERSEIALAVLNGTDVTGLAGEKAAEAESLGYTGVVADNAPTSTDPSIVYFRQDQRAAAERVARDLEVDGVEPLPASGALADAAPDAAEVVLVLGPG